MWFNVFFKIVFIFYSLDHERIFKGEKNNVMYDFIFDNDIFRGLSCIALIMKSLWLQKDTHTYLSHPHVQGNHYFSSLQYYK